MVKDIYNDSRDSLPQNLTNVNGILYFTAVDGIHGKELWKSNGTADGTVLVKEVVPGSINFGLGQFVNVEGILYFTTVDGVHGKELWKSDGTEAGTVLAKDIRQSTNKSVGRYTGKSFVKIDSFSYFMADDGIHGKELWKSDGTLEGTTMLKDIREGTESSSPRQLTVVNNTLYFVANDGTHGSEVWKSDGTSDGTKIAKDINIGGDSIEVQRMIELNNTLYFIIDLFKVGGGGGMELWKSDGSELMQVKTIGVGVYTPGRFIILREEEGTFTKVNDMLYFVANDGINRRQVWKSDGTSEGTLRVSNERYTRGTISNLTDVSGTLFFTAGTAEYGIELWKSNGSSENTTIVKDIAVGIDSSGPSKLTAINEKVYFFIDSALWESAGTDANTHMVKEFDSTSEYPHDMIKVNNTLFISTEYEGNPSILWKSNGTESGTEVLEDFNNILHDIDMFGFIDNDFLLRTRDRYGVAKLWKNDGTSDGTVVLSDGEVE